MNVFDKKVLYLFTYSVKQKNNKQDTIKVIFKPIILNTKNNLNKKMTF